jgi:UDP-2-acetamido-3-amino-2,3-dideoxy-glucuronate N-acetyltransferase
MSASSDAAGAAGFVAPAGRVHALSDATGWYAHPSSIVDDGARIGAGTRVWHFCHISAGATIGERCVFGQNAFVAPGVEIGSGVRVQNNVSLYTGVFVEDDVFLGPSCVLTNVINPRSHVSRKDEFRTTRLGRGCSIGANATIVCGVTIGPWAFVGAGAVVTRDLPAFAQAVGTPARIVGWRCRCGEKLDLGAAPGAATCAACNSTYDRSGAELQLL